MKKIMGLLLAVFLASSLVPMQANGAQFKDVGDDWFKDVVYLADSRNMMGGYGDGSYFGPYDLTTREQQAKVLHNSVGNPNPGSVMNAYKYADLDSVSSWARDAVIWAINNGILTGFDQNDGTSLLLPQDNVTREQIATMLFRQNGSPKSAPLAGFSDVSAVSTWAYSALCWAAEEKVITGNNGSILPQDNATRAELAAMMCRTPNYCEYSSDGSTLTFKNVEYSVAHVDGGDLSGYRMSNTAVDIGYGYREYWGLTNEHGQLVYVLAKDIDLQDENTEPVNSSGRYYDDEAKVPGTEDPNLDEGHVIADSLGGTSNAYNITPQDSSLNRWGDQADLEGVIRGANGCSDFVAIIYYDNTQTQIPSHYHYEYFTTAERSVVDFNNVVPGLDEPEPEGPKPEGPEEDISRIDTNRNGVVTIAEAKAAGIPLPIYSSHWLYKYMIDRDGDGVVGE